MSSKSFVSYRIDFCTRAFPASDGVNRKTLEAEYLLLKQKDKPQGSFRPFKSMGFCGSIVSGKNNAGDTLQVHFTSNRITTTLFLVSR